MAKRKQGAGGGPEVVTYRDAPANEPQQQRDGDAGAGPAFARRLAPEVTAYLTDISGSLDDVAGDEEQRSALVSAVLEELRGHEADAAADAAASRVLERLTPLMEPEQAAALTRALTQGDALYDVATSPYGSHVLERLLLLLEAQCDDATLEQVLGEVVDSAVAILWDLVMHKYGSFVARRVLAVASGVATEAHMSHGASPDDHKRKRPKASGGLAARVAAPAGGAGAAGARFPEQLSKLVAAAAAPELDADAYGELAADHYASPFLQALLRAAGGADEASVTLLIARLLGAPTSALPAPPDATKPSKKKKSKKGHVGQQDGGDGGNGGDGGAGFDVAALDASMLGGMMQDRSASHLMEAVFGAAPPRLGAALFGALVRGRLGALARHPVANFVVQAALAALEDAEQVDAAVEELRDSAGELLHSRRGGVVAALLAAAARAGGPGQARALCNALAAAVAGDARSKAATKQDALKAPLLRMLLLDTHGDAAALGSGERLQLSTIGCAILVTAFKLPQVDCQAFANGVPLLTAAELRGVAGHPGGCRVLESFLEGPASAKQKRGMLRALEGGWAALAGGMAGAVFTEKCYGMADMGTKEAMAGELAGALRRLQSSSAGSGLAARLRLDLYSRDPGAWRRHVGSAAAARQEFADLLSGPMPVPGAGKAAGGAVGGNTSGGGGSDGDSDDAPSGGEEGVEEGSGGAAADAGAAGDADGAPRGEAKPSKTKKKKRGKQGGAAGGANGAPAPDAARAEAEARAAALGGTAVDDVMGLLMGTAVPPGGAGASAAPAATTVAAVLRQQAVGAAAEAEAAEKARRAAKRAKRALRKAQRSEEEGSEPREAKKARKAEKAAKRAAAAAAGDDS